MPRWGRKGGRRDRPISRAGRIVSWLGHPSISKKPSEVLPQRARVSLRQMQAGQTGTVVGISGGRFFANRIQALGIRPGKRITKVSTMFMRGPVTIQMDGVQFALGFGMARRILVEVNPGDSK